MNYSLLIAGIIILVLVLADVFVTTLAPRSTGYITEKLRQVVWRIFYAMSGGNGQKKVMNYAGLFTVSAWIFGWIIMLWVGNALLYIADENSIINANTKLNAGPLEKVYFVGYVLSTMGLGDFQPHGSFWKMYTAIISFSGFLIITIGITYLIPVLSAEMGKRKTSIYISALGSSPEDILLNAWDGKSFNRLSQHFIQIMDYVIEQSQNHIAYPILHNFHSHLPQESIYINLSALDEALSILIVYIPDGISPDKNEINALRYTISDYLSTLRGDFFKKSDYEPEPLKLNKLRDAGIPLNQDGEEISKKLEMLKKRRKLLLGMIQNDGWKWESIYTKNREFDGF